MGEQTLVCLGSAGAVAGFSWLVLYQALFVVQDFAGPVLHAVMLTAEKVVKESVIGVQTGWTHFAPKAVSSADWLRRKFVLCVRWFWPHLFLWLRFTILTLTGVAGTALEGGLGVGRWLWNKRRQTPVFEGVPDIVFGSKYKLMAVVPGRGYVPGALAPGPVGCFVVV